MVHDQGFPSHSDRTRTRPSCPGRSGPVSSARGRNRHVRPRIVTQGELNTAPGRVLPGPGWLAAPVPIVVADRNGLITDLNDRWQDALPAAQVGTSLAETAPAWLDDAHTLQVAGHDGAEAAGTLGERNVAAHPVPLAGGAVAWWLVDNT